MGNLMFKEGQRYKIRNNKTEGIVYKVTYSMVTLHRVIGSTGEKVSKFIELPRLHLEEGVLSGSMILYNSGNDPNFSFKMRKNDVHS